ncbi:NADP-dependent oxidoreductase [Mucilaginibacter sp.]|jgi:hypothetical protein|uniref:NADP-dependent oxidoreductase n=1 Tax=Mucilaginibacter sp. TaxID=1882438 RepID=UPI00356710E4
MNNIISLKSRPVGKPELFNFNFHEEPAPKLEGQDKVLLKTLYVSVDPYMRGQMNDVKSYIPPFVLGEPIRSRLIAQVLESSHSDYQPGNFVYGILDWKEIQVVDGDALTIVDEQVAPLTAYLGVLGMTGITAYMGLIKVGLPKAGETIVVSGAAGAVGTIVGQIGKLLGCRVIGIAGTDEKTAMLKSKFGFDEALNYNAELNLREAIAKVCPNGVDIYFDNVGGQISDAVYYNLNNFARVPLCGAISLYNSTSAMSGPRFEYMLITKSIKVQGFIYDNFPEHNEEANKQLSKWLKEGKLIYTETIAEGFKKLPAAFINLFEGKNEGKMIVKV